jgi:hypothetical protein
MFAGAQVHVAWSWARRCKPLRVMVLVLVEVSPRGVNIAGAVEGTTH